MCEQDATEYLSGHIRQQLLAMERAGLLDHAERRQVAHALFQHLSAPPTFANAWTSNENAPPFVQRGL